jgi:hypothetical protein
MLTFNEFSQAIGEGIGLPFKHKAVNAAKNAARKVVGVNHKRNATIAHHVDQFKVHHRIANDKKATDAQKQKSRLQMQVHKAQVQRYMEDDK